MNQKVVHAVATLGLDTVQHAQSGHPGIVLGAAPILTTLWTQFLHVNPKKPTWFNRDRFVLSAGHGSALLYSLLHLSSFDLSIEDLKAFRKLDSKTPGHPEYHHTIGIDATTGPLGQGMAMAVGMALAEKKLAATYNRENYNIVDHYTYAFCGDGDLMEGISSEAASFAGTQKLSKLIVMYDSNNICLDGSTEYALTENIRARFAAMGWQTLLVEDGNNMEEVAQKIREAQLNTEKPSLIEIKTIIGQGSAYENTNQVHGAPLAEADYLQVREKLQASGEAFEVEEDVRTYFHTHVTLRGEEVYNSWGKTFNEYAQNYPELAKQLQKAILKDVEPIRWPIFENGQMQATRNSSSDCIQVIAEHLPQLFGGSADLASSNMTMIKNDSLFMPNNLEGRNIQYGVREFAMAAIANGLSLHGGLLPFVSTFFVFSDYLKAALRLSAIMHQQVIYVLTHDSVAVGEDGPTHEPVEQLAMVRSIPNTFVFRPADAKETVGAWHAALYIKSAPTLLVLSRQALPILEQTDAALVAKGGYILSQETGTLQLILMATGSEVHLALDAANILKTEGIGVRVVSMPSMELFEKQDEAYKNEVLPNNGAKRLAIEMAHPQPWYKYLNLSDDVIGITTFGASGNGAEITKKYGFTVEHIIKKAQNLLDTTDEN